VEGRGARDDIHRHNLLCPSITTCSLPPPRPDGGVRKLLDCIPIMPNAAATSLRVRIRMITGSHRCCYTVLVGKSASRSSFLENRKRASKIQRHTAHLSDRHTPRRMRDGRSKYSTVVPKRCSVKVKTHFHTSVTFELRRDTRKHTGNRSGGSHPSGISDATAHTVQRRA
jgi:hypothetical protein